MSPEPTAKDFASLHATSAACELVYRAMESLFKGSTYGAGIDRAEALARLDNAEEFIDLMRKQVVSIPDPGSVLEVSEARHKEADVYQQISELRGMIQSLKLDRGA